MKPFYFFRNSIFSFFSHVRLLCLLLLCSTVFFPLVSKAESANDPLFDRQWWIPAMHVEEAWQKQTLYTQTPIRIAVIDTGIDYEHPDLQEHMWYNQREMENGLDDDHNGYGDDLHGWDFYNRDASVFSSIQTASGKQADNRDDDNHGTHIAGVIAATANNSTGIAGIASTIPVQILCLKTFGGTNGSGDTRTIVKAIHYAQQQGAVIVNASWNFTEDDPVLKKSIAESNMLFVCSAGNNKTNIDKKPSYPASYHLPNVISVTAIDANGRFCSDFANYGRKSVDLAAPGKDITSTVIGGYRCLSGTSMAVPMVTATAALAANVNPSLSASELKQILCHSITPDSFLQKKTRTQGYINTDLAVTNAARKRPVRDTKKPVINAVLTTSGSQKSWHIQATDHGGSGLRLLRFAYGKRTRSYFQNGARGRSFPTEKRNYASSGSCCKKITVSKNVKTTQRITVYALDHAGNSCIRRLHFSSRK